MRLPALTRAAQLVGCRPYSLGTGWKFSCWEEWTKKHRQPEKTETKRVLAVLIPQDLRPFSISFSPASY